jgi:hypothetical protein
MHPVAPSPPMASKAPSPTTRPPLAKRPPSPAALAAAAAPASDTRTPSKEQQARIAAVLDWAKELLESGGCNDLVQPTLVALRDENNGFGLWTLLRLVRQLRDSGELQRPKHPFPTASDRIQCTRFLADSNTLFASLVGLNKGSIGQVQSEEELCRLLVNLTDIKGGAKVEQSQEMLRQARRAHFFYQIPLF